MNERIEYRCVHVPAALKDAFSPDSATQRYQEALNAAGREGFELVSTIAFDSAMQGVTFVFKRKQHF